MRTRPAHIEPGCVYCDNDHDPAIACRYGPASGRLPLPEPTVTRRELHTVRDDQGRIIAVRVARHRVSKSEASDALR